MPPKAPQNLSPLAEAIPTDSGYPVGTGAIGGVSSGMQVSEDLTSAYINHRELSEGNAAYEELNRQFGGPSLAAEPKAAGPTPGPMPTPEDMKPLPGAKEIALDVAKGLGTFGTQVSGGVRDYAQNFMNQSHDLASWLDKKGINYGGGIVGDAQGVRFLGHEDYKTWLEANAKESNQLPDVKAPTTGTGAVIRSASRFLTGFALAKPSANMLGFGEAGSAIISGGISDFTGWDEHDSNLSNLIQEQPKLRNPISEYLAANPDDSAPEARFKKSIEGMGFGLLTEGVIKGVRAIRSFRASKVAQASAEGIADGIKGTPEINQFASIGDPNEGLFTKIKNAEDVSSGVNPDQVLKGETTNKVDINFSRIDAPEDIEKIMQRTADSASSSIDESRRGVRTWEQTKLSANEQDAFGVLMARRKGEPLNAEQTFAARQLWVTSAQKLQQVAQAAAANPTEANLFSFRKMTATHYAIQNEVIAARTETARALNIWKLPAGSSGDMTRYISDMLEATGGRGVSEKMAQDIAALSAKGLSQGIEKYVEQGFFAKTKDALLQGYTAGLLTNPKSHIANFVSNTSMLGIQMADQKVASWISQTLGTEGGVELSEAMSKLGAMQTGFKEGLHAMAHNLETGESKFAGLANKLGAQAQPGKLSPEAWKVSRETTIGGALDVIDRATSSPFRLMGASDELFKSMNYRMDLHAQATRLATQDARGGIINPEAIQQRVKDLIENPSAEMRDNAMNSAMYNTFSQKPNEVLEKGAAWFQSLSLRGIPIGKILLPFKNVPINIFSVGMDHSPFAPLFNSWRADVAAGGARGDLAMARMATGSFVMSIAADMALSGNLTGKGPDNPGAKQSFLRSGKQPYSVKFGDTWYSYNRVDPIGQTLGIAADMAEACVNSQEAHVNSDDVQKVYAQSIFAVSGNVLNKTYMQNLSNLILAMAEPKQYANKWLNKVASSVIPPILNEVAKGGIPGVMQGDPYLRQAETSIDAIRRRIPGLSENLPLALDLWGRPSDYRSGEGWYYDMYSPIYIKKENPEPVDSELQRLQYYPAMPHHKMTFNGPTRNPFRNETVDVELSPEQYEAFMGLSGNGLKDPKHGNLGMKDYLNSVVSGSNPISQYYQLLGDGSQGGKAKFIEKAIDDYHKLAKQKMMESDPSLQIDYEDTRRNKDTKFVPQI